MCVLLLPEETATSSLQTRLNALLELVQTFLSTIRSNSSSSKMVARVFIPCFHELLVFVPSSQSTCQVVARFLLRLKRLVWSSRTAISISADPKAMPVALLKVLEQSFDTVLGVESFAGRMHCVPYEFSRFQAFLVIHKLQQYGALAPYKPSASKYGIIRDRRKLNIEPLHLPPEESRAFPGTGSAAERTASSIAQALGSCSTATTTAALAKQSAMSQDTSAPRISPVTEDRSHVHKHSHTQREESAKPAIQPSGTPSNPRKISLASSLAAARAARQAGAQVLPSDVTKNVVQPISIASGKSAATKQTVEF
jgi:hypothetical protein